MNPGMPQFLLFAETGPVQYSDPGKGNRHVLPERPKGCCAQNVPVTFSGAWRFVLRSVEGVKHFEAADVETEVFGERLDLLTLVRALESLDQPSRVTLIGCTNYIRQGIQFGMPEWRTNDWLWEWFGQMVPVKNADLWQRLDRLMAFHQVECWLRRIDGGHLVRAMPNYLAPRAVPENRFRAVVKAWSARAWDRLPAAVRETAIEMERKIRNFASILAEFCIPRRHLGMR
jgi:ribonuclease HI